MVIKKEKLPKPQKPKIKPTDTEKEVEEYLKEQIKEKLKGLCIKMSPQFYHGIPDRLCIVKKTVVVFVELKRKSNVRDIQDEVHRQLRKLDQSVFIVHSKEEVDYLVNKIQKHLGDDDVHSRQLT